MSNFSQALSELHKTYKTLFELLSIYPPDKREQPGVGGDWSAKEIIAHLVGWVVEAERCYDQFAAGKTGKTLYDPDIFNKNSISERANLDWKETVKDLREALRSFLSKATKVAPESAAANTLYQAWLEGLSNDCKEHIQELRDFLKED